MAVRKSISAATPAPEVATRKSGWALNSKAIALKEEGRKSTQQPEPVEMRGYPGEGEQITPQSELSMPWLQRTQFLEALLGTTTALPLGVAGY